jgi:hypothetical protein
MCFKLATKSADDITSENWPPNLGVESAIIYIFEQAWVSVTPDRHGPRVRVDRESLQQGCRQGIEARLTISINRRSSNSTICLDYRGWIGKPTGGGMCRTEPLKPWENCVMLRVHTSLVLCPAYERRGPCAPFKHGSVSVCPIKDLVRAFCRDCKVDGERS